MLTLLCIDGQWKGTFRNPHLLSPDVNDTLEQSSNDTSFCTLTSAAHQKGRHMFDTSAAL